MGRKIALSISLLISLLAVTSCEFLEVDLPKSLVSDELAFSDDNMATSVALGMYSNLMGGVGGGFASGGSRSTTSIMGITSDELVTYNSTANDNITLETNAILPSNTNVLNLWVSAYKSIYDANTVIEGLNSSSGVSVATKGQLQGEALFVRAFSHFYLVNTFGDVPLVTSTDYKVNSAVTRTPVFEVYNQIIEDLLAAENLLSPDYPTAGRLRINKAAAQAMLARVYLFTGDWNRAEALATKVIDNQNYQLHANLNDVFLGSSREAVWQLSVPTNATISTNEASYFTILSAGHLSFNKIILRPGFIDAFEVNDRRLTQWVGSFDTGVETVYFPFKYKLRTPSLTAPEYSTVLRLAEQYLIRAEARTKRSNLGGAVADIDVVRARAGLSLIGNTNPDINQADLLLVIEHERQVELFAEWGHRWFDLIRTKRIDAVLGALKPSWNPEDKLYPIPQLEMNKNSSLAPQNPGY